MRGNTCYISFRRRHPEKNVFEQLEKLSTNTVLVNTGRPRTVWTPTNKDAITAAVQRRLCRNSCDIARELRLSQRRVFKVLRNNQLHSRQ
jgi:hypothetical protein